MLRKSLLPLILLLVASLSIWISDSGQKSSTKAHVTHEDRNPDGYMENFTTTIMDTNGKPVYELSAHSMEHYPYDDHSEFRTPLMTLYRDDGFRWTVVADTGRAEQGTQRILLQGEVVMHRVALGETAIDTEILTRDVLVLPDKNYAETDQPALMTRVDSQLEAVGVRAWFDENRLQLLSEVRGVYESR